MKKKRKIIVLIIIAFVLIIIGFLLNKTPNNKVEDKTRNLTVDEETNFNEEVLSKIYLVDSNLSSEYPIEDFQNLDNSKKMKFILDILSLNKSDISVKDIQKESSKYFDSINIIKENIKDNDLVNYKYSNNKYIKGLSYGSSCTFKNQFISKAKSKNNYLLKSKYYYISATKKSVEDIESTIRVFKSLDDCKNNKNELLTLSNNMLNISEEEYESIKDKLNELTYTISLNSKIISIKE